MSGGKESNWSGKHVIINKLCLILFCQSTGKKVISSGDEFFAVDCHAWWGKHASTRSSRGEFLPLMSLTLTIIIITRESRCLPGEPKHFSFAISFCFHH